MLDLIIYGLIGVAAVLVISFCLAFGDELSPVARTFSVEPVNNAHVNDIQTGHPRFRRTVRTQQETVSTCVLQTTSGTEDDKETIYGNGCRNLSGQVEGSHG
jgi:hypothetical protein